MGLWLKQDGELVSVSGGSTGADGADGADGKGWTGGSYDPETGTVTFTSDDGLGFTTGDLRGTDGIDGLDGNMWHVGSGDPDPTLGEDGDYYLDGTDGWVWIKRSSGWTNLYVNLTGPPGADGEGGGDHDHDYAPTSHTHDKLAGYGVSKGNAPPSGAQIIRSHTNGYTYLGWLNTVSGANTNEPTRIYTNNGGTDSFVRYMTPANFRAKVIDGNRIKAHNGTIASPAYSFASDTDTGMYRKTTNKLGFSAGGKEIAYVASDGIHLANYNSSGNFYRVDGNKGGWYNANHATGMWVGANGNWVTNYGNNSGIGSNTGMYGGLQATTGTGGFQYMMRSTTLSSFSYYTSSSVYKDRITTQSVSDDFDKLRPVTFIEAAPRGRSETEEARTWRLKAKEFGFIAEEIAELYDGHLGQYEAEDGKLKPVGFSWPGLISVTVKEVQDLRKRVAANEATIASLIARIEALEGNK